MKNRTISLTVLLMLSGCQSTPKHEVTFVPESVNSNPIVMVLPQKSCSHNVQFNKDSNRVVFDFAFNLEKQNEKWAKPINIKALNNANNPAMQCIKKVIAYQRYSTKELEKDPIKYTFIAYKN
ncbi:hypothetical protein [Colwellia piezophila]|uniref:hypothetical protein n=1 Tax=Colwellia piezophila TaxID=211668 RepID=UPI00036E20C2|nr:hypothetical protein [Colwellia piezophila]